MPNSPPQLLPQETMLLLLETEKKGTLYSVLIPQDYKKPVPYFLFFYSSASCVFFYFIEIYFTCHKIQLHQVPNSKSLFYSLLCNHHHYPILEHFHHTEKKSHLHLPLPQPLAITNQPSLSVDLPILKSSCKCNHMICNFFHLYHKVFKVHSCCAYISTLFPFFAKNIPFMHISQK